MSIIIQKMQELKGTSKHKKTKLISDKNGEEEFEPPTLS